MELAEVEQIARAPVPASELTDDEHLSRCLARLDANLKRRMDGDDRMAVLRVDTQRKVLGKMSKDKLSFITAEAIRKFIFFPTIAELLDLGEGYKEPHGGASRLAKTMLFNERALRQRGAAKRLKYEAVDDIEIAKWPGWLCEGLRGQRLLTKAEDGSYSQDRHHLEDYLAFVERQKRESDAA